MIASQDRTLGRPSHKGKTFSKRWRKNLAISTRSDREVSSDTAADGRAQQEIIVGSFRDDHCTGHTIRLSFGTGRDDLV